MLFKRPTLGKIVSGAVDLGFRRLSRPLVWLSLSPPNTHRWELLNALAHSPHENEKPEARSPVSAAPSYGTCSEALFFPSRHTHLRISFQFPNTYRWKIP